MAKKRRSHGQGTLYKRNGGGLWIASWYDHTGKRRERSTRTTDRSAAERILNKHVAGAALRRDGMIDATKDRYADEERKPLIDHVHDYIAHCEHIGMDRKTIHMKRAHLNGTIVGTGAQRLSDLGPHVVERHLARLKDANKSARTVNQNRADAVAFRNWCVKTCRAESNPLAVIPKLDESGDRRRVRRPLNDDELARLLVVAEQRGRKA